MTFLSPMMLAGAAAVGVPIALHFFYKARYQRLPWAAMSFLREALEETSRRLKFQEWILLALRCLVILLLAVALARPGFSTLGSAGRGEAVDAVLVFDTSYSMAVREGDKARLDLAKDAALGVLDSLPPNSSVQVIGCADRAETLGPQSRFNLDQARQLVAAITPTSLSTDFLPGLTAALDAAESGAAPAKEIYLFTDLQKAGFERQQGAVQDACDRIRTRANLVFVRCGRADRRLANVAVTDVAAVGTIPHTKSRVPFVVTLKNTGAEPVAGLRVGLELDGRAVGRDVVQVERIDPGQVVPVTLTGTLDEPGLRVLTVRVTGDALPGDNRLDRLILVRDVIRVLLVDGTPSPDAPTESGSHFVRNALTPVPDARTEEYYVRPAVVPAAEVSPANLANVEVVYLLNVPAGAEGDRQNGLPADFVARLKEFVANGGGLVIGGGDQVVATDYNRVLGSGGAGLLPFDLAGPADAAPETDPLTPAPESVEVPSFLAPFRAPPFSTALRGVGLTKLLPVREGAGGSGGRVLLRTADNKPLVASRVVGEGEVVFVSTTLDERWGNFPGRGSDAFVPFTQYTLAHLTGRRVPGGNRTAGEPLVWFPPEAAPAFELTKPPKPGETATRKVRLPKAAAADGEKLAVTVPPGETADAGVYRVVAAGQPAEKGAVFAVAPDLRESANLDVAADADLAGWVGFQPVVIQAGGGAETEAAVHEVRVRREWTEWVLMAVLAAVVIEAAWAWLCGRAW